MTKERKIRLYGCGEYVTFTESELKKKFEKNFNLVNGWAREFGTFENYLAKVVANNTATIY